MKLLPWRVPLTFQLKTIIQSPQRKAYIVMSFGFGGAQQVWRGSRVDALRTKMSSLLVTSSFQDCHLRSMKRLSLISSASTVYYQRLNLKTLPFVVAVIANRSPFGEKTIFLQVIKGQTSVTTSPLTSNPINFEKSPPMQMTSLTGCHAKVRNFGRLNVLFDILHATLRSHAAKMTNSSYEQTPTNSPLPTSLLLHSTEVTSPLALSLNLQIFLIRCPSMAQSDTQYSCLASETTMSRSALQLNFMKCGMPAMLSPPSLCAITVFGALFLDLLLSEFQRRQALSKFCIFFSQGECSLHLQMISLCCSSTC